MQYVYDGMVWLSYGLRLCRWSIEASHWHGCFVLVLKYLLGKSYKFSIWLSRVRYEFTLFEIKNEIDLNEFDSSEPKLESES